jgi:hypothetical protein
MKKTSPIGKPIGTKRARELAAMRRTFGAGSGRPRSDAPRCACGQMTLHRALNRRHNCEEPKSHHKQELQV